MLVTFTDFGVSGPYLGQMKAAILTTAPAVPIVDLFSDAPDRHPRAAAHLLAAYAGAAVFPEDSVFLCVVDPGVGGQRRGLVVRAHDRWFVGPDNGLFAILLRRAQASGNTGSGDTGPGLTSPQAWAITWQPPTLSNSFHGRDLFAPVAARLARGGEVPGEPVALDTLVGLAPPDPWPDHHPRILYIDLYGNAMTGLPARDITPRTRLRAGDRTLSFARTFSAVPPGSAFWYENANGLVELAVNQGRADVELRLTIDSPVHIL